MNGVGPAPWLLHAVDLALVVSALELGWWWRRGGQGLPAALRPTHLLAGLALMLALRLALSAAPTWAIAASLTGAGLAHLLDLRATRHVWSDERPGRPVGRGPRFASPRRALGALLHHALPPAHAATPPAPPTPAATRPAPESRP